MYTTTRVIKVIDQETVLVGCTTDACKGCKAEMFCNTKNDTSFIVRKENQLEVQPNDWVELFMEPKKTVGSIALVFVLPLLLFPVGYLIAKNYIAANEMINALAGLTTMAIAFLVTALISKKNKRALMPIITKVIKEGD